MAEGLYQFHLIIWKLENYWTLTMHNT